MQEFENVIYEDTAENVTSNNLRPERLLGLEKQYTEQQKLSRTELLQNQFSGKTSTNYGMNSEQWGELE